LIAQFLADAVGFITLLVIRYSGVITSLAIGASVCGRYRLLPNLIMLPVGTIPYLGNQQKGLSKRASVWHAVRRTPFWRALSYHGSP